MRKEVFELVKKELGYIGILFLIVLLIFNVAFFKENFLVLFRSVLALFWLFVLPGYFIMLYWKERLEFVERIVIGIALAAGVIGIFSYYFGLMGLSIKYHTILLPLAIIIIGLIMAVNKKNSYILLMQ